MHQNSRLCKQVSTTKKVSTTGVTQLQTVRSAHCKVAAAHLGQGNVGDARCCQDDAEGCVGTARHATRARGVSHIVLEFLQCTEAEDSAHRLKKCTEGTSA